jgi:hypothetical protein
MKKATTVSPEPKLVVLYAKANKSAQRVLPLLVQCLPLPVGEKQAGKGGTWMKGRSAQPKFSGFGEFPYDMLWDEYVGVSCNLTFIPTSSQ